MNTLIRFIATGFGSGYMPIASGTWGSAVGMLLAWFFFDYTPIAVVLTAAVFALSIPVATRAEKFFGKKDDGRIVIDEIVGYWISVLFLPHTFAVYAAAFFLFRLFDVLKPLGIRSSQNLPGGWGIVIDDVLAGILTNALLQILVRVIA
ncbi:MAG: phosphatidylglycerophosphatase A [Elusimicrobia bacterium]|nr:phosphatidylglycerophosphatase A [Elusimicrobiota bacterium]